MEALRQPEDAAAAATAALLAVAQAQQRQEGPLEQYVEVAGAVVVAVP